MRRDPWVSWVLAPFLRPERNQLLRLNESLDALLAESAQVPLLRRAPSSSRRTTCLVYQRGGRAGV